MSRDLVIQIRLPRWSRRAWLAVAVVAATVLGTAVWADVQWTPFKAGEKLSSQKLNDNFKAVADAIATLQAQGGPAVAYCGTVKAMGGSLGGYVGAAKLCAPACPKGGAPHICVAGEMSRLASAGTVLADGSYSSGIYWQAGNQSAQDCEGFTTAVAQAGVAYWKNNGPVYTGCSNLIAIHCCR